jgi:hypothetical protein
VRLRFTLRIFSTNAMPETGAQHEIQASSVGTAITEVRLIGMSEILLAPHARINISVRRLRFFLPLSNLDSGVQQERESVRCVYFLQDGRARV